jgi:hypothetical protein
MIYSRPQRCCHQAFAVHIFSRSFVNYIFGLLKQKGQAEMPALPGIIAYNRPFAFQYDLTFSFKDLGSGTYTSSFALLSPFRNAQL